MDFELVDSKKLGGDWFQEFMVVRRNVIYLRVAGDGKNYRVMTATASEHGYRICHDGERLWGAATQLARSYNCEADKTNDRKGRTYIMPFEVVQDEGKSDRTFTEEFKGYISKFFDIYDNWNTWANR